MAKRNPQYPDSVRKAAVKEFVNNDQFSGLDNGARAVGARYGVSAGVIYQWVRQSLTKPKKLWPNVKPEGTKQPSYFKLRNKAMAQQLVTWLATQGIAAPWNQAGNGWHFIVAWTDHDYKTVERAVKGALPDLVFIVSGPENTRSMW